MLISELNIYVYTLLSGNSKASFSTRDELSTPYSPDAKISINITDISHPTDRVSIAENSNSSAVSGTSDMDMLTSTITSSVLNVDNHLYELQRTSSSQVISSVVKSYITSTKDINKQHSKVDFNGDDVSPLSSHLSLPKKTIHTAMKNSNNTDPCQNLHVSFLSTTSSTNNNTVVIPPPPPPHLQQMSQGGLSPTIIIPHLEVDQ